MSPYQHLVKPVLFRIGGGDPEVAHVTTLRWLRAAAPLLRRVGGYSPTGAARTVFGIRFPNPVGLAAGMDKDAEAVTAWSGLGFGFVEVGTVTRHPQPGNDKPRLYRLRDSEAIINRMGFNNAGAQAMAGRLAAVGPVGVPIGVSLGKSKVTPLQDAVGDYTASLQALYPYGDYFAVNVSSPNTPGLRTLQDRGYLDELLGELCGQAMTLAGDGTAKPIVVKVAPDLGEQALAEVLQVCSDRGVAGLIATNTTLGRDGLAQRDQVHADQAGGLSGRPLTTRALDVVRFVTAVSDLPVIGVGGIFAPQDAVRMIDAGASLVQLYTGFIYQGPGLVRGCVRALSAPVG